jgi:hypothetical protein
MAYAFDVEQQCRGGLNFGYFYARSPIIAHDGERAPTYTMGSFTRPPCPAAALRTFGSKGSTLSTTRWGRIIRYCASTDGACRSHPGGGTRRGFPLAVLDVRPREVAELYQHKLVLVRPDQHVAWRGNEEPADAVELIDLVRGAARATSRKVRNALPQRRPRNLLGLTA